MDPASGVENALRHSGGWAATGRAFPTPLWTAHAPPTGSTGRHPPRHIHDNASRISKTRDDRDGRRLTDNRRFAPTSVHLRRNPRSRSAESVFNFSGIRKGPCPACGCSPVARDPVVLRAALGVLDRSGFGPGLRLQHSTDNEGTLREVRVTIVEPDPKQLEEYAASDRAALAERNAKFNQELEEQAELDATSEGKHSAADGRNAISLDLETY